MHKYMTRHQTKKLKKTVTFAPSVLTPTPTKICNVCKFRNVCNIREMINCSYCKQYTCFQCVFKLESPQIETYIKNNQSYSRKIQRGICLLCHFS